MLLAQTAAGEHSDIEHATPDGTWPPAPGLLVARRPAASTHAQQAAHRGSAQEAQAALPGIAASASGTVTIMNATSGSTLAPRRALRVRSIAHDHPGGFSWVAVKAAGLLIGGVCLGAVGVVAVHIVCCYDRLLCGPGGRSVYEI